MGDPGGQRGSPTAGQVVLSEESISENPPRFELTSWRREFGLIAGITGRGNQTGRGFDLGLWTEAPVAETMARWRTFRASLEGADGFTLGNQIHGTEVMTLGPTRGWTQVEGIDGWVTASPGSFLGVTVADCIPVYLAVPGRAIALLHAGWRGTAAGILKLGVERLIEAAGTDSANVIMHCGVGICGLCYEVGSEVMDGCGILMNGQGPWRLDLRQLLIRQAQALGVRHITCSTWCSAHDRTHFYSHRASRGVDGRMVAYLGMPRLAGARVARLATSELAAAHPLCCPTSAVDSHTPGH